MYSENDIKDINHRIKVNLRVLLPILAIMLAGYIVALVMAVEWLVMTLGGMLFVVACYGVLAYLRPNMRYRRFLLDMNEGLTRNLEGSIVAVSEQEDLQDGVRVLPVHIMLAEEQDERIIYLNASKAEAFPKPGTAVDVHCYGRHIREVYVL